jgi:hypothetical protein
LKYSNQGDDYIREALQDLKESYAAGKLTWKKEITAPGILQRFAWSESHGLFAGVSPQGGVIHRSYFFLP